jgi:beta-lysine 5,6-aminomutase beta subunit
MHDTDVFIKEHIGRKIVVVGASTGTDAHTVGIDAIMNMKGYAGHYGLERYEMFETLNMGSQILNEDILAKAIEMNADAILVSQTVTQKDVHVNNLVELVEMMEAEGLRNRMIVVCGGPRITHELAKELGYDAGFGMNTYADNVASFLAQELHDRNRTRII